MADEFVDNKLTERKITELIPVFGDDRDSSVSAFKKKLLPMRPPLFVPEFLVSNESCTGLVVAGPSGVLVLQLPQRYPPYGAFDNNKEVVYCRSHSLDERLLSCSDTLEVRQVRFHPGSPNDSHILVLTSDNSLRLYGIVENEAINMGVYNIGEKPGGVFPGSKTPFLDLYGEIAVDFDFGQPEIANQQKKNYILDLEEFEIISSQNDKSLVSVHTQTPTKLVPKHQAPRSKQIEQKKKSKYLIWPVYILRGDGSVFSIYIDLNQQNKPSLIGPLPMSNQPENLDQSESCSLICLNTWPQIVCIAMSNGLVSHSVVLDIDEDTYEESHICVPLLQNHIRYYSWLYPLMVSKCGYGKVDMYSVPFKEIPHLPEFSTANAIIRKITIGQYKSDHPLKSKATVKSEVPTKELITVETVKLELGISTYDDMDETFSSYKCPILLHRDSTKISRYFATHNGGVHSVDIFCVDELQNFVSGPESLNPTSDIFVNTSTVEYLVCTKTANSDKFNPIIGFAVYCDPTCILALLKDGNLVSLSILPATNLPKIEEMTLDEGGSDEIGDVNSPLKKMLKEPFDQYIQKILKKASTQPVLKLSNAAGHTTEECYELLQRSSQVFREEYFKYYAKAREELEKRIYTLTILKETQKNEIERMISGREDLRATAESLAEKYEDIKDKQDELLKRCEQLLMLVARKKSEPSDAEKKFMEELNIFSARATGYQVAIDKLKNKAKYQQIQTENWKAQEIKKIASISEIQAKTIKQNLHETTQKVAEMKKEVAEYKKSLNIK